MLKKILTLEEHARLSQMPEWSRHDGFEGIPSFVLSRTPGCVLFIKR